YVEGVAGLLSDIMATAEATADSDLLMLQAAIQGLAKEGTSSATFATALHDRLAESGAVSLIPRFDDESEGLAALAPLGVSGVMDEDQLAPPTWVTELPETAVLAIAPAVPRTAEPAAAGEDALVLTPTGIRWIDSGPGSKTPEPLAGARGGAPGLVAWSQTSLYVNGAVALQVPRPVLEIVGPCGAGLDFAARVTAPLGLASEDVQA